MMLQVGPVERPCEASLVWAIEGERLTLQRRQQHMGTITVWSRRELAREWRKRSEHKCRAPAPDGERQHRPHLLECSVGAKALIRETAGRHCDAIVQAQLRRQTKRGAEDGLSFAERIAELGVVAIEKEVRSNRELLLRRRVRWQRAAQSTKWPAAHHSRVGRRASACCTPQHAGRRARCAGLYNSTFTTDLPADARIISFSRSRRRRTRGNFSDQRCIRKRTLACRVLAQAALEAWKYNPP